MPTIEDDYGSFTQSFSMQKRYRLPPLQKGDPYNVAKLYLENPDDQRNLLKNYFLQLLTPKMKRVVSGSKSELQT